MQKEKEEGLSWFSRRRNRTLFIIIAILVLLVSLIIAEPVSLDIPAFESTNITGNASINVTQDIYINNEGVEQWLYNQSDVNRTWAYNQTQAVVNNYNYNQTDLNTTWAYNMSLPYDAFNYNQTLNSIYFYNQTSNSIYYYNQSLSPTLTIWAYNQTSNSIYFYNQTSNSIYYYNQSDTKFFYNQTSSSIYYYNQTKGINIFNQDLNTTNAVSFSSVNSTNGSFDFFRSVKENFLRFLNIGNFTSEVYVQNGTSVSTYIYNQSVPYDALNYNQSLSPTITPWLYNQSDGSFNSTYNTFAYNQTGGFAYNQTTATFNQYGLWWYNQSLSPTITTWLYNQSLSPTITPWLYNQSDGSFNSTYNTFAYNQTGGFAYNQTTATFNQYGLWWYNQSLSPTITQWLYNQTTGSLFNYNQSLSPTITPWLYNQSLSLKTGIWNATATEIYPRDLSDNVGIGNTTPTQKLVVAGHGIFSGDLYVQNNSLVNQWLYNQTIPASGNWTGNSTAIWSNTGIAQVGIGTATPREDLQINEGGGAAYLQLKLNNPSSSAGIIFNSSGNSFEIQAGTSGEFIIYDRLKTSYRMYIDTNGKVGIGTATPTQLLEISNPAASNADAFLKISNLYTASDRGSNIIFNRSTTGEARQWEVGTGLKANDEFNIYDRTAGAFRFNIDNTGNVSIDSPTFFINAISNNVGIGTATPSATLNVKGTFNVSGTSIIGDGSTNELTIGDDDPVLTNLQSSTPMGEQSQFACYNTDTKEISYSDDTTTCYSGALSPFFQVLNGKNKIEEIEFLANLNQSSLKGYQQFPLINSQDLSRFTTRINERKNEIAHIDLLQIVLFGTYGTEKAGQVNYQILDTNIPSLLSVDNNELTLSEGNNQSITFEPIPKEFSVYSAILKVYGYYEQLAPKDYKQIYNIIATEILREENSPTHIYYSYELKKGTTTEKTEFNVYRDSLCDKSLTWQQCVPILDNRAEQVLNNKVNNFAQKLNTAVAIEI